jgi:uncharacterized damage-inducible protein DinB
MSEVSQAFLNESREYLLGDFLPKIERCLERLTDEQVWWRANEQSNSIGNLLLHLEGNVRQWIVGGVGGAHVTRVRAREFDERAPLARERLRSALRATLEEAGGVLARLDSSALLEPRRIQESEVTVLSAVFHVVEHFSMHTGQILLLTKLLTGGDLALQDSTGGVPQPDPHMP